MTGGGMGGSTRDGGGVLGRAGGGTFGCGEPLDCCGGGGGEAGRAATGCGAAAGNSAVSSATRTFIGIVTKIFAVLGCRSDGVPFVRNIREATQTSPMHNSRFTRRSPVNFGVSRYVYISESANGGTYN